MQSLSLFPEAKSARTGAADDAPSVDFGRFWAMYPRKRAKPAAERAWAKLKAKDRATALAALPQHVDNWRALGTEQIHIPHPATWLNGRRWEDELDPVPAKQTRSAGRPWWTSHQLMELKAREVGIAGARPGEELLQFRARIQAAIDETDRYGRST